MSDLPKEGEVISLESPSLSLALLVVVLPGRSHSSLLNFLLLLCSLPCLSIRHRLVSMLVRFILPSSCSLTLSSYIDFCCQPDQLTRTFVFIAVDLLNLVLNIRRSLRDVDLVYQRLVLTLMRVDAVMPLNFCDQSG